MTSASLIDPKLMVFVCMSACILGGEGSSDYGKYLKVCFTFWNSESLAGAVWKQKTQLQLHVLQSIKTCPYIMETEKEEEEFV